MTTFFTADTHFGQAGIIGMCQRPHATTAEMDDDLVARWNATVGPNDVVWHLGDFAHGNLERAATIFKRLNGSKRLARGNHDRRGVVELPWAGPVENLVEVKEDGHRVILCHYPMRAWPEAFRGSIHLYGHVHGLMPPTRQSRDVGVDCWGFRPVRLAEILSRLAEAEERPEELRLAEAAQQALED